MRPEFEISHEVAKLALGDLLSRVGGRNGRIVPCRADRIGAVILARMDSKRFPGKALAPLRGVPLLRHVIRRALMIRGVDQVCLATTERSVDDPLVEAACAEGIAVYRGATEDVAKRLIDCAFTLGADWVVRLNADSPFLDPELISYGISLVDQSIDFITNIPERTFPYGVSVEIISLSRLVETYPRMSSTQREHVTLYYYETDARIPMVQIRLVPPIIEKIRLVVDTPEDLSRLEKLLYENPSFDWKFFLRPESSRRTLEIRRL